MSSDTITVRIVKEAEIDADTADLTVVVEGSSVVSGSEAFKKAEELRTLIEKLQDAGVEEKQVKLRSVQETPGRDYNREYIAADADLFALHSQAGPADIGFHLGNSTTTTLDLRAVFRVSPFESDTT